MPSQEARRGYQQRGGVLRRLQKYPVKRMVRLDGGGASMPRLLSQEARRGYQQRGGVLRRLQKYPVKQMVRLDIIARDVIAENRNNAINTTRSDRMVTLTRAPSRSNARTTPGVIAR